MKYLLIIAILFTLVLDASGSDTNSALENKLRELDHVMERRDTYYMLHEHEIDSLKNIYSRFATAEQSFQKFNSLHNIFMAYRSYQNDSARVYADKEKKLADLIGDKNLSSIAQCDNIFTSMSRGDFTGAVESHGRTNLVGVNDSIKVEYYMLIVRLYSDLSNFTSDRWEDRYAQLSKAYSDTLLSIATSGSYAAQFALNFRNDRNQNELINTYTAIINRDDVPTSVKGMYYSILGDLYLRDDNTEQGLIMKAQSAIIDIKCAIRETTSKGFLAEALYACGDLERAAKYIHVALEDAESYNAPHRKSEIGKTISQIENSRYSSVNSERQMLWIILVISLLFAVAVSWNVVYIRRQNRRLRESKSVIEEQNAQIAQSNMQLSDLNGQLKALNSQLRESIKIKDEYIGYGFYLNSQYIEKMEGLYKFINIKTKFGQVDDIRNSLKLSDIKAEKDKLLKEFDLIFLRLFPSFIEQYKELFPADDTTLNELDGGYLTPEMRIFALIRLGITDNNNIAQFLNYSVNTINTYKTKAKKRSIVHNDEFESRIMKIRSIR